MCIFKNGFVIFFYFPYGKATPVNQFLHELKQNLTVIVVKFEQFQKMSYICIFV